MFLNPQAASALAVVLHSTHCNFCMLQSSVHSGTLAVNLEKLVGVAVACRLPSEHAVVQDFTGDCDPLVSLVACHCTPARQEGPSGLSCLGAASQPYLYGGRQLRARGALRPGVIGVPAYQPEKNALNQRSNHASASESSE